MIQLSTLINGANGSATVKVRNRFLQDVLRGLTAKEKYLQSKYFYNEVGDKLFQQIMNTEEYYLSRCEMEIFTLQTSELAKTFTDRFTEFDIVELGAGDATKCIHLLKELYNRNINYTYYPVDISANVIEHLHTEIPKALPGLSIHGLNGEYFEMLEQVKGLSSKKKVILFLGSNIGNVTLEKAVEFCRSLRDHLLPGDLLLIGFDLKKDPFKILAAYNDSQGITKAFNLNLLSRINEELGADFNIENFRHYPTYDPATGTCKSYLVSITSQTVHLHNVVISFQEGETIFTEVSQKYTTEQTDKLASATGFRPIKHLSDSKNWFLDAIWEVV